jgi:hypothetical protein
VAVRRSAVSKSFQIVVFCCSQGKHFDLNLLHGHVFMVSCHFYTKTTSLVNNGNALDLVSSDAPFEP